jgi:hypothetical protein
VITLSKRYNRAMCWLIAPAILPVVVHSYRGVNAEDCEAPSRLFSSADAAFSGRGRWLRENLHASEWTEGSFAEAEPSAQFTFSILRSYDPKKLYHRPEEYLAKGAVASRTLETIGAGRTPIHVVRYNEPVTARVSAYLLVYGSKPVGNPYLAQVAGFPIQLLSGTRPMTLFFITGNGGPGAEADIEARIKLWLGDAWRRYQAACLAQ